MKVRQFATNFTLGVKQSFRVPIEKITLGYFFTNQWFSWLLQILDAAGPQTFCLYMEWSLKLGVWHCF